jgi:hypothetical protein
MGQSRGVVYLMVLFTLFHVTFHFFFSPTKFLTLLLIDCLFLSCRFEVFEGTVEKSRCSWHFSSRPRDNPSTTFATLYGCPNSFRSAPSTALQGIVEA